MKRKWVGAVLQVWIVKGLPEEGLQQGNREVREHEGGVLVGSQQAAPQQQLGILSSKGDLLQLQPFVAVAAAYCYHLQQSPHADFRGTKPCRAHAVFCKPKNKSSLPLLLRYIEQCMTSSKAYLLFGQHAVQ